MEASGTQQQGRSHLFIGRRKDGDIHVVGSTRETKGIEPWNGPDLYRILVAVHHGEDFEFQIETDNAIYLIDNLAGWVTLRPQLNDSKLTTNSAKNEADIDMIGYRLKKDVSSYSHIEETKVCIYFS